MALETVAPQAKWQNTVVALGSVIAHTAVLLVFQLGQPRIFFSMARDGLLPPVFASVHPKFKTPHVTTILTGLVVGGIAAFANVDEMVSLTNIGTLFAFVLVCIGIPILQDERPRPAERPFRVPGGAWALPLLGAVSCVFLMYYLPGGSWWRFIGWLALGLSIYLSYGYTRSGSGRRSAGPRARRYRLSSRRSVSSCRPSGSSPSPTTSAPRSCCAPRLTRGPTATGALSTG